MPIPKAFYFLFYAALAALSPFLVLYYQQLGFSGRQIGLLTGLPPLVTLVSSTLWSGAADATQQHRWVLALALCGTLGAVLALSFTSRFIYLIPVVGLYAFFLAPVTPLVDNAVLDMLGDLSVLGSIYGSFTGVRSGHSLNTKMVRRLAEQWGMSQL